MNDLRSSTRGLDLPPATVRELPTPQGPARVEGHVIGFASSQRKIHTHRPDEDNRRCAACRWSEITIMIPSDRESARRGGCRYIVHTHGPTIVPGEVNLCHLYEVKSAHRIIEILTVRRPGNVYLPKVAALALADAAGFDPSIEDAYVNRAVA